MPVLHLAPTNRLYSDVLVLLVSLPSCLQGLEEGHSEVLRSRHVAIVAPPHEDGSTSGQVEANFIQPKP